MAYAIAAFLNNPSENSEIESMRQLCIVSSNKPEDYVAELMRLVKVKNDSTD